jgi:hypothetical protein
MSAIAEERARPLNSYFQWPAIFAGAIAAAGVSFTLHAFAAGVGLSLMSTAPTWRDSSGVYWLLTGLYLLFVALCAFAVGGYVAGRMRAPLNITTAEMEFRDGVHGLVTWGLAVVMTAILALGVAATASSATSPNNGAVGAAQSVAGENIIASELDELFRAPNPVPDIAYRRSEAARILLKSSSHAGIPAEDRAYLARTVENATGAIDPDMRVDRVIAESARELRRARIAAVLQAFFIGAALFVGAAVAWFAACEGGRERELGVFPIWDWSLRRRRR